MPPRHVDRDTFLANLRQSGLVSAEQLRAVADRLPQTHRGRVLARALVELGLLTRFQAERILIGRTQGFLLGPYRILDQIGQGGMGRVFKAAHRNLDRVVALKVLAPNLLKDKRARQLFHREVLAAASLVHPNIVTAYDADMVGDRCFLVMEYVDGPNLDQLVSELGPLPVDRACDFVRQVAAGLQCAFAIGMVHRDIKPANLLLKSECTGATIKISDFGLARLHRPIRDGGVVPATILVKEDAIVGTPDYLSPEQSRSIHQADIRSDLYSLGCTFYFLLTGQVPFPGGSSFEKLVRHCTEEPTPVEKLRPEVPREVSAIVRRLMAKDPRQRFQTPAALAAALAPFAVRGPLRWQAAPAEPLGDSDPNLDAIEPDDRSALINTVPPAASSTPVPLADIPTLIRRPDRRPRRRMVSWLLGIAIALLTVSAVVGLLMQGR
ncbi:MAG TPA: serine/threonine-protein kinase [Gemmataceae bacterium]|nr:serine/threonine-protein kinase [Gemmataceae bacterium]